RSETVLVVDDSADTVEVLRRNLELHGYAVLTAADSMQAMSVLEKSPVDLVVTDLRMPGVSGLDLVRHVKENFRDVEVLMITGYPSIETAVEAVRHGAVNYIAKPFTDEELLGAVEEAAARSRSRKALRGSEGIGVSLMGLIGRSPPMLRLYEMIEKAGKSKANVLLRGETGTGKELVARAIHAESDRAKGPFVSVRCGAVPKGRLAFELVGEQREHGSPRSGLVHAARGGSLYLAGFTSASKGDQDDLAKLLDGGLASKGRGRKRGGGIDVRFLAGTDRDIDLLAKAGGTSAALLRHLGTIEIEVPPLRDRGDDILLLARFFVETCSNELGISVPSFSDRALEALTEYSWPGNVRELETTVRRLTALSSGSSIDVPDLPSLLRFHAAKANGTNRSLEEIEGEHILRVLEACDGNLSKAAEILGIDRKTLRTKVQRIRSRQSPF
ncbi:MAG: sigma-54-dependent transcriptional regulator, partial [Myxococcota bacterium]